MIGDLVGGQPFFTALRFTSVSSSVTRAAKRPSGPLNAKRPPPPFMAAAMIIRIGSPRPACEADTRAAATGRLSSSTTVPVTRAMAVLKNDFDSVCPPATETVAVGTV